MPTSLPPENQNTQKFFFQKNSRHATNTFGLDSPALNNNVPRFPFEYYIRINLNRVGTAQAYIDSFYTTPALEQLAPLVKTVELPSVKITTDAKNQYNRKRISQKNINFESVKMVFHDVVDGKTLKFWDMYYRYYFADGNEPGMNIAQEIDASATMAMQRSIGSTPTLALQRSIGASALGVYNTNSGYSAGTYGRKRDTQNIVSNNLDNHLFGYNLPKVNNERNLIASIDIFQVHGGRYNQTTLVNPRISAFSHDTLNYAESSKTLELTFTVEYEYMYYTIQNLLLGGTEVNNESSLVPFANSQHLEIPALAFTATLASHLESNNPLLTAESASALSRVANVQAGLDGVMSAYPKIEATKQASSSVLDGILDFGKGIKSTVDSIRTVVKAVRTEVEYYQDTVMGGIKAVEDTVQIGIDSVADIARDAASIVGKGDVMNRKISEAERKFQNKTFKSPTVRGIKDAMYKGRG